MKKRATIPLLFFLFLCIYGNALDWQFQILYDNSICLEQMSKSSEKYIFFFFKTRGEAKAYKRKHGIRGKIRKQENGTFAIETKTTTIQVDQETAHMVSNGIENDGIVFAVLIKAPPKKNSSALEFGPDKIPPLTFWQKLNGGIVEGGKYNDDGYYIGPAPLMGTPPGPGKFFKASRVLDGLKIGKKITKAKAIERLQKGQDVYASSRSAAKSLM